MFAVTKCVLDEFFTPKRILCVANFKKKSKSVFIFFLFVWNTYSRIYLQTSTDICLLAKLCCLNPCNLYLLSKLLKDLVLKRNLLYHPK